MLNFIIVLAILFGSWIIYNFIKEYLIFRKRQKRIQDIQDKKDMDAYQLYSEISIR